MTNIKGRSIISRRGLRAAVVCAIAGMSTLLSALPAASEPGIIARGRLAIHLQDASVPDSASRRLLVAGSSPSGSLLLRSLDQTTGAVTESVDLAPYSLPSGPPVLAWNARDRLLYLVVAGTVKATGSAIADNKLLTIDARLNVVHVQLLDVAAGFNVKGMSFDATTKLLYMGLVSKGDDVSNPGVGTLTVQVAAYDPAAARAPWPTGHIPVAGCPSLQSSRRQAGVAYNAATRSVYVACAPSGLIATEGPGVSAVAAVDVTDPMKPRTRLHQVPGVFSGMDSLVDLTAGRIMMVSQSASADSSAVWVFDEAHSMFVGSIGTSSVVTSIGLDEQTGQMYIAVPHAILVSTDRGLKIPQALIYPLRSDEKAVYGIMHVLPSVREFAVPTQEMDPNYGLPVDDPYVQVYQDRLAPYQEIADPDPDLSTTDLKEEAGKTAATFTGDGGATGFRVHNVGGFNGLMQNAVSNGFDWWNQMQGDKTGLEDGDHEIRDSFVSRLQLSHQSAAAGAIQEDADERTRKAYSLLNDGKTWPHEIVACNDLGAGSGGRATPAIAVSCDATNGQAIAWTTFDHQTMALTPDTSIVVGSSSSDVRAFRKSTSGLQVRAESTARDITLVGPGGAVRIGAVRAVAITAAHGRPGTAVASLTRTFDNVSAPGYSCSLYCDAAAVLRSIDDVLGVGVRVEAPEASITQTPKGARAAVLIDPWRLRQDEVLANQDETQQDVPALRISIVVDKTQRSRVVLDFASVYATANYNIYAIDPDAPVTGPPVVNPPPLALPPVPPVADVPPWLDTTTHIFHPGAGWALLTILPPRSLLVAAMWALLTFPLFLAVRRRHLTRLIKRQT